MKFKCYFCGQSFDGFVFCHIHMSTFHPRRLRRWVRERKDRVKAFFANYGETNT